MTISETHLRPTASGNATPPAMDDAALWPDEATFGEVVYPPGSVLGPRVQQYLQLVLLYTGEMTVWLDGVPHVAPAETAAILLPGHGERFAFAAAGETRHSWFHARCAAFSPAWAERFARLPWPLPLSPPMASAMRDALNMRVSPLPTRAALQRTLAAQMLWRYLGEGEMIAHQGQAGALPALTLARQFVEARLPLPLSLEQIAAAAAVSPTHLVRLFRAHLHTTPMAYVWERRVRYGIELLEGTGLTVREVAERCGFQTSYHFSRRVRHYAGIAPTTVRQRAWRDHDTRGDGLAKA